MASCRRLPEKIGFCRKKSRRKNLAGEVDQVAGMTGYRVHKDASRSKNKTFPYYEDLCIVFGKDRAQGNRARDLLRWSKR
ncbi:hypothetical protein OSB04_020060 [Centaurea solstitialis]|uniref:Uncharacterized protein n=1 Tax=Centaurea solstitialis TaxID=347529 RepID=A0AA38W5J4_9ASTR|nr:hypothetical protein OSB04_020060 [Centaurea solstitialis]